MSFYKVILKVGKDQTNIEGTMDYIALQYKKFSETGKLVVVSSVVKQDDFSRVSCPGFETILRKKMKMLGSVDEKFTSPVPMKKEYGVSSQISNGT